MYSILDQSWSSSFELPNFLLSFPIDRTNCLCFFGLRPYPFSYWFGKAGISLKSKGCWKCRTVCIFLLFLCPPGFGIMSTLSLRKWLFAGFGYYFFYWINGLCWGCQEVLLWFRRHRPLTEEALKRNGYDVNERKLYNVFTESWVKVVASYAYRW